jgi:cysteinyl-tRNA synthetase
MKIYNSLTKSKEAFKPLQENEVKMYVCGVTPYDYAHIGNARPAVVFDTLYRFLKAQGNQVTYARNFTDVDDKIINRANEQGLENWQDLPKKFIQIYHEDMAHLNVLGHADDENILEPRVTDHIEDIIVMVKTLLDKGIAYIGQSGDVLYDTTKFADYGQLSGNVLENLNTGQRVAVSDDKRNATDFVLWKSTKENEPMSWSFDYEDKDGQKVNVGRPGWHIECSAMSKKHLGESFDIHGGGEDLKFPHHECEIAQSKGACGEKAEFARYWMHNAFINIDGEKMSKSLGNFKTIHNLLEKYSGEAIRLWILSTHYRKPVDLTEARLDDAERKLKSWYLLLQRVSRLEGDFEIEAELSSPYIDALNDDLNTSLALSHIETSVKLLNKSLDTTQSLSEELLASTLYEANSLGLLLQEPDTFLQGEVSFDVDAMVEKRNQAKADKNWALADQIRDELKAQGVILEDGAGGKTSWRKG